jgi:hypothetical protein
MFRCGRQDRTSALIFLRAPLLIAGPNPVNTFPCLVREPCTRNVTPSRWTTCAHASHAGRRPGSTRSGFCAARLSLGRAHAPNWAAGLRQGPGSWHRGCLLPGSWETPQPIRVKVTVQAISHPGARIVRSMYVWKLQVVITAAMKRARSGARTRIGRQPEDHAQSLSHP